MKKLIELFNKKYGYIYGVMDDSIDNEDVFKAYKIIKTLCADDTEIMELLDRIKLPSPKTARESIDKIDAEHINGGMTEDDLMKYNIPFDGREVIEITYNGDMENYEHVELEEGLCLVKISDEPIDYKCLKLANMIYVSNDGITELTLYLDEGTTEKIHTFNNAMVAIVEESIEGLPLGVGIWIMHEKHDTTYGYVNKIKYFGEGNFNLLHEKYIPYVAGKKLENNAEIFNNIENNEASGYASHAEGWDTTASGDISHAEGHNTTANGHYSHAEGNRNTSSGEGSHAEGENTTASGGYSHTEGNYTTANGHYSHAEGVHTTASGEASHAEGDRTTSLGTNSHIEGTSSYLAINEVIDLSSSTSNDSIMTSWNNKKFSLAKGESSHVEGKDCLALGLYSHAEGENTTASGEASHAEGESSIASGYASHAEGRGKAEGYCSHAEGIGSVAKGDESHAEGYTTKANGYCAHSEGENSIADGYCSHAEGDFTKAIGDYSHSEGNKTIASSESQHVEGAYNIEDTENKYIHIVGNGRYDYDTWREVRSNAHTLDWDGNGWYAGKLSQEGTPTEDKDLTTKKYVDDKTASIDTTINNTLPSNGSLNLTTSKIQTTTLATDTEVILPTVEGYTEIHLFFLGISGTNVSDTNVAWNSKPTIEDNKKYEFIYTYVNSEIGWLGKAVVYTV